MLALYVMVIIGGIAMMTFSSTIAEGDPTTSPEQVMVVGGVYTLIGMVLSVLFAVPFFWRRGNGEWIFQVILIVIGLTSCCTWPATIPLMIFGSSSETTSFTATQSDSVCPACD